MKRHREIVIVILITLTLLLTIGIQLFWNIKNLEINKQRIVNEVQQSLNEAIEEYYSAKTKTDYVTIVSDNLQNIFKKNELNTYNKDLPELNSKNIKSISIIKKGNNSNVKTNKTTKVYKGKAAADSIKLVKKINSIIIAIANDSIDYNKLDSLLLNQLKIRELDINYSLFHKKNDSVFYKSNNETKQNSCISNASSSYLKKDESLYIMYPSPIRQAAKRGFVGILLSISFSLIIIFSLFYLLYIIRKQKQLDVIKNDLIGNITHEFKTPITTATAALEAIQKFNFSDDKDKTNQYISISKDSMNKLYAMVEKLLETATLDSKNLTLSKEPINIVSLLKKIYHNTLISNDKRITLNIENEELIISADYFHIENAIANVLDNAIKYGGDKIDITLTKKDKTIEIWITDNGGNIDKQHRDKIFDKFYRIPKGNTHNVKGFGLGLFYTKEIFEKHGGKINLIANNKTTTFKMELPDE